MKKAIVKRKTGGMIRVREGRGYSLAELKEVGLDGFRAMHKGIPVDKFRCTNYQENVEQLSVILKEIEAE
ncbi:MAG: ribosomal protein L13e [Nitrososphaerales archaeon]